MDMGRILGLSLIGAGPGNIFGPGMIAGALETFAGAGRGNVERGGGARGSGSAGGAKTAPAAVPRGAAASGEKKSATEAKAEEGANGQDGRGADDDKARLHFDAAVAPH